MGSIRVRIPVALSTVWFYGFALIGAVFNVTLAGLPILFVLKDESLLKVSMIPGLFLILSGMLFTIHDELQALRLNERYRPLF